MIVNGYVLKMVGYMKNDLPTFAQMPNRITKVGFTTVSPTSANMRLAVCCFYSLVNVKKGLVLIGVSNIGVLYIVALPTTILFSFNSIVK